MHPNLAVPIPPRSQGPGVPSCCPGAGRTVLGTQADWGEQLGCFVSCPGHCLYLLVGAGTQKSKGQGVWHH